MFKDHSGNERGNPLLRLLELLTPKSSTDQRLSTTNCKELFGTITILMGALGAIDPTTHRTMSGHYQVPLD